MLIKKSCSCFVIAIILSLFPNPSHSISNSSSSSSSNSNFAETNRKTSLIPSSEFSSAIKDATLRTFHHARTRRRRFARFPPEYIIQGIGPPPPPLSQSRNIFFDNSIRFNAPPREYSSGRQPKSYWRPLPNQFNGIDYSPVRTSPPVMAHRTPRLIFRDDFPIVSGSNNFFQSNQLPDIEDDYRGETFFHTITMR